MKVLHSDLKNGEIKVKAESGDDIFALRNVIGPGDFISGFCERKIKIGRGDSSKSVKKTYFLTILVEKVELGTNELRLNGKTVEEKEDIPKGSYQTIEIIPGTEVRIKKEKWSVYHIKKIKESSFESRQRILIVVFDREEAIFAIARKSGFEVILRLEGDVQKKGYETKKESRFFHQLIEKIKDYVERHKITNVILASPAFWKEELGKLIKEKELKQKIVAVSCSSVTENAIYEVLKSNAIKSIVEQERAAKEIALVDSVAKEISKNGPVAYGLGEVADAIGAGNIKTLLFTDKFFNDNQTAGKSEYIEGLISMAERAGAEAHIIGSEHEGGMRLDGLGGIAALLRYKSYK